MVYTAMNAASPQKCSRSESEMRRVQTTSRITTETSTRLELSSFMRRKRDKASTTKNPKRGVVRSLTIKKLKW